MDDGLVEGFRDVVLWQIHHQAVGPEVTSPFARRLGQLRDVAWVIFGQPIESCHHVSLAHSAVLLELVAGWHLGTDEGDLHDVSQVTGHCG